MSHAYSSNLSACYSVQVRRRNKFTSCYYVTYISKLHLYKLDRLTDVHVTRKLQMFVQSIFSRIFGPGGGGEGRILFLKFPPHLSVNVFKFNV
jgi:hypothetical protein